MKQFIERLFKDIESILGELGKNGFAYLDRDMAVLFFFVTVFVGIPCKWRYDEVLNPGKIKLTVEKEDYVKVLYNVFTDFSYELLMILKGEDGDESDQAD